MNEETLRTELEKQGYTEEDIMQILNLAKLSGQLDLAEEEMGYADELRATDAPEGRRVGQDRLYLAANPLEFLGNLGTAAYGMDRHKRAREGAEDILAQQVAGRGKWAGVGGPSTPRVAPIGGGLAGSPVRPPQTSVMAPRGGRPMPLPPQAPLQRQPLSPPQIPQAAPAPQVARVPDDVPAWPKPKPRPSAYDLQMSDLLRGMGSGGA